MSDRTFYAIAALGMALLVWFVVIAYRMEHPKHVAITCTDNGQSDKPEIHCYESGQE